MKNFETGMYQGRATEAQKAKISKEEHLMNRRKFIKLGILGAAATAAGVRIFGENEKTFKEDDEKAPHILPEEIISDEEDGGENEWQNKPQEKQKKDENNEEEEGMHSIGELVRYEAEGDIVLHGIDFQEKLKNYWKKRYREDFRLRESFEKAYIEMEKWDEKLKNIFQEVGVPEDFRYLAIPESYWDISAKSSAGAVGPFQIIAETALRHNLKVGGRNDERTDPLLSGRACAEELKELYEKTGDWDLALSGYNGAAFLRYLDKDTKKTTNSEGKLLYYEGFLKYIGEKITEKKNEIKSKKYIEYKIRSGDSVSEIAEKFEKRQKDIIRLNRIKNNKIKIGQILLIPLSEKEKKKYFQSFLKKSGFVENLNYPAKFKAVIELIEDGFVVRDNSESKNNQLAYNKQE